jgi:hypothetical protein
MIHLKITTGGRFRFLASLRSSSTHPREAWNVLGDEIEVEIAGETVLVRRWSDFAELVVPMLPADEPE